MKQGVRNLRGLAFVFALLGLLALSSGLAYGQAITGSVVGAVTDSSGAAVVNAEVVATSVGTNVSVTTKSNGSGEYRFDNLLAGTYRITVKASGFKTTTVTASVQLNTTGTANINLVPGAASETVEVSGEAPIIDTTTAQLQTTYDTRATQDSAAASVGLGVLNLSLLQAGVASSGGIGAGTGPAVGGQRPRDNNFTIEGIDNNDKGVTGPLTYIPNDAVANFTILQNQFSPEFGHSNGGQFNSVVISGTNSFHGRAYEYFQNRDLNAIDQSVANQTLPPDKPKNPRYDNNRFGGQLGGPIFKNKLFFFVNYEQQPIGQAAIPGQALLAPTSAGYSTLMGIPGVSSTNISQLQQFAVSPSACPTDGSNPACPTAGTLDVGGTPVEVGVLPVVGPNYQNYKILTTSMDYDLSAKDQIRGRYIYNNVSISDTGAQLPIFYTVLPLKYHLISLSEYHTFTPSVTNEFRVGYNRYGYNYLVPNFTWPGLDQFPNVQIDELNNLNVGPDGNAPQYSQQNLYQAVDNLTWIKGRHSLKFGGEYRKYISPQLFIQRSRGDYDWADLSDYAFDNVPDFAERSSGSIGYSGDQWALYGFVNDTWKLRSNLSLNLGLRYEYTSTPFGWTQQSLNSVADDPGLITFGSPQAPKKDFMPRIGFAWSPGSSGKTSIRGGFGIGYDVLYDNIGVLSRPPEIGSTTTDCPDPTNPICTAPFLANGGIPSTPSSGIVELDQATARASTASYLPVNVKYPYSESWNLGVQHVFASNYTAEVRYVGTRGVHLNVQNRLNVVPVVTPSRFLPTYMQAPSQAELDSLTYTLDDASNPTTCLSCISHFDPVYANDGFTSSIVGFMPWGSSTYHGLQAQLNRRFSNGLQFQGAYTWSHAIDNSTADFFSTILSPRRPQDFRNLPAERSNSGIDHRHRFTISAIYDIPFFSKSSSWFARNFLGNYEFAPGYTYETGEWATVQSNVDSNLNGDNAGDRAILNPSGASGTGSGVTALTNSGGFTVAYLADNPGAQYIVAGKGALTNAGRNTLLTKPINNFDVSLVKRISVTERFRIEFMAQFLNAFNHPEFTTGSVNQINSIGRTSQRNFLIPDDPTFNNSRAAWPSNARSTQLVLKFIF